MVLWRSRRDSNPRYAFGAYNGLANRRLQPLGHSSVDECLRNMGVRVNNRCATGAPNAARAVRGGTKSGTPDAGAHQQRSLPVPVTPAISVAIPTITPKGNPAAGATRPRGNGDCCAKAEYGYAPARFRASP